MCTAVAFMDRLPSTSGQNREHTPLTDKMNKQWLLAERPTGLFTKENFELKQVMMPDLEDEQFLVRVIYLSLDPTLSLYTSRSTQATNHSPAPTAQRHLQKTGTS